MTVQELRKELEVYDDSAIVIVVDWNNGREYIPTVGGDDPDEYTTYCRIGLDG